MDKLLNQDEIDAIFRTVRDRDSAGMKQAVEPATARVEDWSFCRAGGISKEEVRSIGALHEGFARNLTHSLGAYLRVPFEANLVSVEQLAYRELLARLPETAYYATFRLQPGDHVAALEMDLGLAFPIIEVLLGGEGGGEIKEQARDITEIEEQILEVVAHIVGKELQTAWTPLGVEFEFDMRQQTAQLQRLLPPSEKTLSLSFELRMPGSRGSMNLAFSAGVSSALQRKLSKDWDYRRPTHGTDEDGKLRKKLLASRFVVSLGAVDVPVRADRLLQLKPGDVLMLRHSADSPFSVLVGGKASFLARAVRSGELRAAQIMDTSGAIRTLATRGAE